MQILGLSTDKNQSSSHLYILNCWRQFNNRNLKQRPRRKQQQRQKTIGFMSKTTSPHARASRFLVHFFDVHCTATT